MRFCTSELKTDVICRYLVRRFPGQRILSVSGVRRDESRQRSKTPAARPQPKLTNRKRATSGLDWCPIADCASAGTSALLAGATASVPWKSTGNIARENALQMKVAM
jgi:hypothetical protein